MSGGLDSTSLALHMLSEGYEVRAYAFDYGQKHAIELSRLKRNIKYLQKKELPITLQVINLRDAFSDSASSLRASNNEVIPEGNYKDENMKSTVVENRNIIFSSIIYGKALGWANKSGDNVLITMGLHAGDHCFTKETGILTPTGIKTIDKLNVGDNIYSWDETSNKCIVDKITDITRVGVVDKIYNIKTTTGSIRVTGDHKFYKINLVDFNDKFGYNKEVGEVYAKNLCENDILITSRVIPNQNKKYNGKFDLAQFSNDDFVVDDEYVYIKQTHKTPRYIDPKYIVQLMAWYISEGWTSHQFKKNSHASKYLSAFSQSLYKNFENCESIQNLFNESGIPIKYSVARVLNETNEPKEFTYTLSGIVSAMLQTAGCKSSNKCIPTWLMNMLINDKELRLLFIRTMIFGDGHFNEISGGYSYSSKSGQLIKDFCFLIKLSGYSVKYLESKTGQQILYFGNLDQKNGLVKFGDVSLSKIISITIEDTPEEVFDITVGGNHNFFAGSLGNILVHNCVYPDCRPESQEMAKELFRISNWNSEKVDYIAPFINIDKGDVLMKGYEACVKLKLSWKQVFKNTISCYTPNEKGESCGRCGTCTERIEAFEKLGLKDPIKYQ